MDGICKGTSPPLRRINQLINLQDTPGRRRLPGLVEALSLPGLVNALSLPNELCLSLFGTVAMRAGGSEQSVPGRGFAV